MKRMLYLAGLLLLVVIILGVTGCNGVTSPPSSPTALSGSGSQNTGIWVTGTGEVTVTPDIAILEVGVEIQEPTVTEAQAIASATMEKITTALTDSGVKKEDIQTRYFRIWQQTRRDNFTDQETITGYRVTNMVTAKIRDIDKAAGVIDAVTEAGGDLTRIDNISFSIDDPSDYYELARQEALSEAKAKAEQLAGLAGINLGQPTYISEGSLSIPIQRSTVDFEGAIEAPSGTSISPGELDITLTVQVIYAIQK